MTKRKGFTSESAKEARAKSSARGPNKEKAQLKELLDARFPNWHPVIGMAEIANDETLEVDIRLSAMKEVSKYIAPQLKAIEVSNPDGTLQPSLHIIRETIGKPPTKD